MYMIDVELNGVYDTFEKLDNALKHEYSNNEGLNCHLGINTQKEFEYVMGTWITFKNGKTQICAEV